MRALASVLTSVAVAAGVTSLSGVASAQTDTAPTSYDVRESAPARAGDLAAGDVTPFVGLTDGYLTKASDLSAEAVARGFLRRDGDALGLATGDVADLRVSDSYTSNSGTEHLTFDQVVDGVPVFGAEVKANVDAKGRLINVSGRPTPGVRLDTTTPALDRRAALRSAREAVGGEPDGGFGPLESARLVAFPDGKSAELSWNVWVDSTEGILHETVVSASTGAVLFREVRTVADSAHVWENHPDQNKTPKTVSLVADPTWLNDSLSKTRLAGNNTHAYADVNANNLADAGENVPANGSGTWIYPVAFTPCVLTFGCTWTAATPAMNQNPQTVGLFYLVNRFHDHLLSAPIGFDEGSRNFEQVNSTGLGLGNDRVLAEANDGSGTNNANFSTPPDGSPGRMQQYLFNTTATVSSSDSADIVYHEYTHGLTNRLVGNGSGLGAQQSRAMGEGWSDFYSNDRLVELGEKTDGAGIDLLVGEYAFGPNGIRRQAMDCNPGTSNALCSANGTTGPGGFTLGDMGKFTTNGVHDNGEIWSQTLWDLREAVGVTNARAIITDGLRLTPNAPTFLQARDAILQAATGRGVSLQAVWSVFAARGMGFSASTPSATVFSATEAFDTPTGLAHVSTTLSDPSGELGDADGAVDPGETVSVATRLRMQGGPAVTGVVGTLTTTGPGVVVNTGSSTFPSFTTPGEEATGTPMSFTVPSTATCGSTFDVKVAVASSVGPVVVPDRQVRVGKPLVTIVTPNTPIPDNNPTGISSTLTMPAGTVSDLEVTIPQLTHTYLGDLRITLTSPTGTEVVLVDRPGPTTGSASADNLTDLVLADSAASSIQTIGSAGPVTGRWKPAAPLAAFNGEQAAGTWTLKVSDNAAADLGTLNSWGLLRGYDCATTLARCVEVRAERTAARAALGRAEEALTAARQQLTTATTAETAASSEVEAAKAAVTKATAALAQAKKALKKAKKALKKAKKSGKKAAITKAKKKVKKATKRVKQAQKALAAAQAQLTAAQARLAAASAAKGTATTLVNQAVAARDAAAAAVTAAEQAVLDTCGTP